MARKVTPGTSQMVKTSSPSKQAGDLPIALNEVERVILLNDFQIAKRGEEAQQRIQNLVAAIVQRAGRPGTYQVSPDLRFLNPVPEKKD